MRTPVGSSNSIARSLRHSSPAWLLSGVIFTRPEPCAAGRDAAAPRSSTKTRACARGFMCVLHHGRRPRILLLLRLFVEAAQQLARGARLLRPAIEPLDALVFGARTQPVRVCRGGVVRLAVQPVEIAIVDREIEAQLRVRLERGMARQEAPLGLDGRQQLTEIAAFRLIELVGDERELGIG